jgi:hypothetical protein
VYFVSFGSRLPQIVKLNDEIVWGFKRTNQFSLVNKKNKNFYSKKSLTALKLDIKTSSRYFCPNSRMGS